ncbi:MAG: LPS translocon maturation chaperone LptM [Gammaproteobacteria bacterium]
MKLYKVLLLLLLNSAIAGCGQPGPLYLPSQATPINVKSEPAQKPEPQPEKNK